MADGRDGGSLGSARPAKPRCPTRRPTVIPTRRTRPWVTVPRTPLDDIDRRSDGRRAVRLQTGRLGNTELVPTPTNKVDLLFVVDHSPSMASQQGERSRPPSRSNHISGRTPVCDICASRALGDLAVVGSICNDDDEATVRGIGDAIAERIGRARDQASDKPDPAGAAPSWAAQLPTDRITDAPPPPRRGASRRFTQSWPAAPPRAPLAEGTRPTSAAPTPPCRGRGFG